ncbi:MAG TPA: argininosuccinate lyase [Tepidisphaeraceae bacterium]|jgi:argininosuccinate lyase|nr:argininosuccinate lyase [Tepidisphaeraceae bacterium]
MDTPTKSWQARIGEATDAIAQSFVESMSYDWRLYKADIAGSIAHATMLAKVGLISDPDRDAITAGLQQIQSEIDRDGPNWPGFKPELEDIHMCVESALTERIGDPARRLHTGRSRNDQVATDLAMWLKDAGRHVHETLELFTKALVGLAARSSGIVMPSFTHLQRAQPINAGAEALAWAEMFGADILRLRFIDLSGASLPLGSGAIAGSSLPINPSETVELLKVPLPEWRSSDVRGLNFRQSTYFETVPQSSIERTASRDQACDFVYACAMIAQHLSRFAEQWIIYMTTEFGFIKIADRYTTSSSMMPQKRNPDMLELIRGRCGNVYGDLFALMTILKGLPIGYNRDLQEDKRIVFRAYDTVSQCLTMAAAIVNSASYDKARIEPTLDKGFLDATSLAEYLVTKGIPFRTAHHIVGTLVARCEKEGKHSLAQLSVEAFNEIIASTKSPVRITDDVYQCLGAANVVKRYQSAGAAGGKPFEDQLQSWKKRLNL